MPWQFEQTSKSKEDIFGLLGGDKVRIPIKQPTPQHKRGLTVFLVGRTLSKWSILKGWYDCPAIHCAPSRTKDGADVCPEFIKFRKRLSFPRAEATTLSD